MPPQNDQRHGYGILSFTTMEQPQTSPDTGGGGAAASSGGRGAPSPVAVWAGTYEGMWSNDRKQGTGTFAYSTGDRFSGQWRDDLKSEHGTYIYASGQRDHPQACLAAT